MASRPFPSRSRLDITFQHNQTNARLSYSDCLTWLSTFFTKWLISEWGPLRVAWPNCANCRVDRYQSSAVKKFVFRFQIVLIRFQTRATQRQQGCCQWQLSVTAHGLYLLLSNNMVRCLAKLSIVSDEFRRVITKVRVISLKALIVFMRYVALCLGTLRRLALAQTFDTSAQCLFACSHQSSLRLLKFFNVFFTVLQLPL